jgi:hypothetical protein
MNNSLQQTQDLERTWPTVGAGTDDDENDAETTVTSGTSSSRGVSPTRMSQRLYTQQDRDEAAAEAAGEGASTRSIETRGRLRRILRAFTLYARRVSYCQVCSSSTSRYAAVYMYKQFRVELSVCSTVMQNPCTCTVSACSLSACARVLHHCAVHSASL